MPIECAYLVEGYGDGAVHVGDPSDYARPVVKLDLNDAQVRKMAELDHVPCETWGPVDSGGMAGQPGRKRQLLSVTCDMCGQPWPCETRLELRSMSRFRINA